MSGWGSGSRPRSHSKIHLEETVDAESVQASYNAGALKLELAKKPEAQPKQIKIKNQGSGFRDQIHAWEGDQTPS
jgi:hypothetical protein